jgi:hypothetical protein
MRKNRKHSFLFITLFQFILILGSALFFIQDAKADNINVPTTISSSTTWVNGNVYIISAGTTTINNGATVSVDPGAIVKFSSTTSRLTVSGILDVNGTTTSPAYFTSYKDDIGGDTNGDGSSTSPAAYDWKDIYINSIGKAYFDYAVIHYGGKNGTSNNGTNIYNYGKIDLAYSTVSDAYYGIRLTGSAGAATISNSKILNNDSNGVQVDDGTLTLTNSAISDNIQHGLNVSSGTDSLTVSGNIFSNNASRAVNIPVTFDNLTESNNTATDNGINGIYTAGTTILYGNNINWAKTSLPYVTGDISINSGATLSVDAGAIIKLESSSSGWVVNGALNINGTATDSVYFTSLADDVGGDTGGDGSTNGQKYEWEDIYIGSSGRANINYAVIRYGGKSGANNTGQDIYNYGGIITLSHSTVSDAYYGVRIAGSGGSVTISDSEISNNDNHGVFAQVGTLNLTNNTISDNSQNGLRVESNVDSLTITGNDFTSNASYAIDLPVTFDNLTESDNTATFNYYNGIYTSGTITSGNNISWAKTSIPYVVGGLTIASGSILSIDAGAIIKLSSTASEFIVNGVLDVNGTTGSPVYFTSLKDDSENAGGDTNNDCGWGEHGDWKDIYINSGGTAYLDHAIIKFGGNTSNTNIYNNGGTLVMNNSSSEHSDSDGIKQTGGTTTAKGVILAKQFYGARVTGGTLEITDKSLFFQNETHGIYNSSGSTINAENNFWYLGGAPGGGPGYDTATGSVDFDPWWGKGHFIRGYSAVNKLTNEIRYTEDTVYDTALSGADTIWETYPYNIIEIEPDVASTSINLNIYDVSLGDVGWYGQETMYDLDLPHDLMLNTDEIVEDSLSTESIQFVISHELGHSLGLADSDAEENPTENVMYGYPAWQQYLGDEDKASYDLLYNN